MMNYFNEFNFPNKSVNNISRGVIAQIGENIIKIHTRAVCEVLLKYITMDGLWHDNYYNNQFNIPNESENSIASWGHGITREHIIKIHRGNLRDFVLHIEN